MIFAIFDVPADRKVAPLRLWKEIPWTNGKRNRNLLNAVYADVALSAFQATNVVPVQIASLTKCFL
jgi:hypothetical protein